MGTRTSENASIVRRVELMVFVSPMQVVLSTREWKWMFREGATTKFAFCSIAWSHQLKSKSKEDKRSKMFFNSYFDQNKLFKRIKAKNSIAKKAVKGPLLWNSILEKGKKGIQRTTMHEAVGGDLAQNLPKILVPSVCQYRSFRKSWG